MRPALIALAAGAALAVLAAPAFAQPYGDRDSPDRGYQGQDQGDQSDQDQSYQGQDQNDQDQDQDSRIQDPRNQGNQGDQDDQGNQGYQGNQGDQDRGDQGPGYQDRGNRYGGDQGYQNGGDQSLSRVERRLDHVRNGIDRGVQAGDLSGDQAARLRMEYRQIASLDRRYTAEGMTSDKIADLNSRLDLLNSRVNYDISVTRDNGRDDPRYDQ